MCGAEVASDESTFVAVCAAQGRPVEEVRVTRLLTATADWTRQHCKATALGASRGDKDRILQWF